MNKFKMACSCGDTMTVVAASRGEAVNKFKEMMNGPAIAQHMTEKHPGQPPMSVADFHAMIEKDVVQA